MPRGSRRRRLSRKELRATTTMMVDMVDDQMALHNKTDASQAASGSAREEPDAKNINNTGNPRRHFDTSLVSTHRRVASGSTRPCARDKPRRHLSRKQSCFFTLATCCLMIALPKVATRGNRRAWNPSACLCPELRRNGVTNPTDCRCTRNDPGRSRHASSASSAGSNDLPLRA